tara:strand:+ start:247 stop:399 length:153 start_codon:yes stop_codon:yes gene_type:complete
LGALIVRATAAFIGMWNSPWFLRVASQFVEIWNDTLKAIFEAKNLGAGND